MTDKNANTEIRKEFCPNCEAETPCTHEAELFVCDICGEDFAKYIVSRKASVPDVSTTQDVLIDIKTPSSIENTNPDYYKIAYRDLERKCEALEADYVISNRELLIKQVEINRQSARIAELEAERRWIPVGERLPEEKQSVLALDRTGTAYHWEYSKCLSNIFVGYYTHWMPLPEPPEVV